MTSDDTSSLVGPRCSQCGQTGAPASKFCANCGAPLDPTNVSPPAQIDTTGSIPVTRADSIPAAGAVLVVHRGAHEGTEFTLNADVVSVGRSAESDVFLDDVTVSRRHAEFHRSADGWRLVDVGSLNGTYVNRDRVEDQRLNQGDEVQIGKYRFIFLHALGER